MPTDIKPADAFAYSAPRLARRHGPAGYADYRSYRPWLRDEFAFRCVYCLIREQWGRVSGEFELDHFLPQVRHPSESADYDNLLYACRVCNLRKADTSLPDPARVLTANNVLVYPDGGIVGLSDAADEIIRVLCLNSPQWKRWRRTWMRIIELAAEHDESLLVELFAYPEDLPNLRACRAPSNTRPEGIEDSHFALRTNGELPAIYLS